LKPLFQLSLRQLASRKRLALVLALAALPVALSWVIVAFADDDINGFVRGVLDGMIVAAMLPIVTIATATAAFGNELEDRTLGYLTLKPIARWRIVLPKMLTALAIGGPPVVVSGVVTALIGLHGDVRAGLAVGVALAAGATAYSAMFTWAGLMTSRALGFALVYVFLWEGLLTSFLGGIRYLSVRAYTLAIMRGIDGDSFEALETIQLPAAVGGALLVAVVFLFLTVRRLEQMDVP